jgi:tetratricopeptide (TPR) repeat protein
MRNLFLLLIVLLAIALPVSTQTAAQAQPEATPAAVPPAAPPSTLSDSERLDLLEQRVDEIAERADGALDTAFSLLGLFEFVSGAVGLIIPFLAVAAALIGFRRLQAAEEELREARIQFEENVAEKERALDILREQLEATAQSQRQQLEMSMHSQRETSSKAALALSLLPLGERQYRAQDYTGALDTYQRAFDLDPNNPVIYYRMGYVYTQSGELEKAEQFLTRALELDPGLTAARAALGYV